MVSGYEVEGWGAVTDMMVSQVAEVMAELAALEDPKVRAVNEKHGDDHGVNLGKLRALAKRLKTQQELARAALGDRRHRRPGCSRPWSAAPRRSPGRAGRDAASRPAPKVHDWLVELRGEEEPARRGAAPAWFADPDPVVASAGWA